MSQDRRASDAQEIGSEIVAYQRQARFAGTTSEEWARRVTSLILSQPGIQGPVEVRDVRPVDTAAGGSNGTMLFEARYMEGGQEKTGSYVLRFLPAAGLFHKYDVRGQFELQHALERTEVPVPPQYWLDEKGAYLTTPGYVMGRVPGTSTPMTWKASGILIDAAPAMRRQMILEYVSILAKIHAVDWEGLGLGWLEARGEGSRPIEREVNWYWDSLSWAAFQDYVARFAPIRDWLIANEPDAPQPVLCHGDVNLGNYLFENGRITGVVDWEMAFLGSPECDVCYLRLGDDILQSEVPHPEGALTYDEIYSEYERISGRKLRNLDYYEFFTSYRNAVITVLAMKHYPPEVSERFLPSLKRSIEACFQRARQRGIAC